jgi:hypothetical protein
MPRRHRLAVALAAGMLGLGAAACSDDDGRESIDRGNPGQDVPEGSRGTVETNPSGLTATGTEPPAVTQSETGP